MEKLKNLNSGKICDQGDLIKFVPLDKGIDESFLGKYEINKLGQIRIISTGKTITLVDNPKLVDYPKVILRSKAIKEKRYAVHRLLAIMFIPKDSPDKTEVDHIDGNRFNYDLSNLRWVTSSENKLNRSKFAGQKAFAYIHTQNLKVIGVSLTPSKSQECYKIPEELYLFYQSKDLQKEIWCKHPVYNVYISSFGVVRTASNRFSLGYKNNSGYRVINLDKHLRRIHTLVAETFIARKLLASKEVVDHLNTIRDDNSLENLRICSQQENMNNSKTKIKFSKIILQYDLAGNFLKEWKSAVEAYKFLGVNPYTSSHISDCCKGKMRTYKGYIWKYK